MAADTDTVHLRKLGEGNSQSANRRGVKSGSALATGLPFNRLSGLRTAKMALDLDSIMIKLMARLLTGAEALIYKGQNKLRACICDVVTDYL